MLSRTAFKKYLVITTLAFQCSCEEVGQSGHASLGSVAPVTPIVTEKPIYIVDSERVGIGIENPTERLHVNGKIKTNDSIISSVNIKASGGFQPANSALWLFGNLSGESDGGPLPFANIMFSDTAASSSPAGGVLGLNVNQAINPGAGSGSRSAILGVLSLNTPTPGTKQNFYTAIFAHALASTNDGGAPLAPRGSLFGFGGIAEICQGCQNYAALVGAEFDVLAPPNSSVYEKIGLQIAQINNDSVQGTVFDAAIAIVNDRLGYTPEFGNIGPHPGWNFGLAFGKPGNDWPIHPDGTILGSTSTINEKRAAYGIDLANVQISQYAFRSTGFSVAGDGRVKAEAPIVTDGALGGFVFADRNLDGSASQVYRLGGSTRLWSSTSGDILIAAPNGFVGIGGAPDQKLTVNNGITIGRYTASGWTHSSDSRLKSNVMPIEDPLEKIAQLEGVEFTLKSDPAQRRQIGFIAQDVEKVFPEVVATDELGYKSMNYAALVAPLVEATKRMQQQIQELDANLRKARAEIESLKRAGQ